MVGKSKSEFEQFSMKRFVTVNGIECNKFKKTAYPKSLFVLALVQPTDGGQKGRFGFGFGFEHRWICQPLYEPTVHLHRWAIKQLSDYH